MFSQKSWRAERETQERESLARLERGCKPRNTSEAVTAFVRGYDQTGRGSRPSPVYQETYSAGRVLVSYATPVAFTTDDGAVYVSCLTYSSSTSRHLSHLHSALIDAGYVMDARDCRLAPDGVYGGWLRKERTAFERWVPRHSARGTFARIDSDPDPLTGDIVWTSDNGKWSIACNNDETGYNDIPGIVLGSGGWTAAHVFADGYTMATGSKPLPAYVHKMAVSMANGDDAGN